MAPNTWKSLKIKSDETHALRIGHRSIWIHKIENGWKIAGKIDETHVHPARLEENPEIPEDITWSTLYSGKSNQIQLAPQLPGKPVLLKPKQDLVIYPKQSIRIFITLPVSVQLKPPGKTEVFREYPTHELSHTWFGDTISGEAAFSCDSPILESPDELDVTNDRALCPIKIRNTADVPLEFIQLIINTTHLNLYWNGSSLITDMVMVEYKGQEQISKVTYSRDKSIDADHPVLSAARESHKRSIFRKSFSLIRSIYQT